MHQLLMGDIAVGKDDLLDLQTADQFRKLCFGMDRYAVRVETPGKSCRIPSPADAGDLRGSEGDDPEGGVIAEAAVEIMEIPACRPHDDDPFPSHIASHASIVTQDR